MRIGKQDETRIIITVKSARRANPGEKKANGKPYKQNQMVYETFDSLDIFDAKGEEVMKAVLAGLQSAARQGK